MSDWPAPSSSAVSRRQSALKGCMGALPQMFQWRRVLRPNNKCIATHADVQTPSIASKKQTQNKRWRKQVKLQHQDGLGQLAAVVSNGSTIGSSSLWKVSDTSMSQEIVGMDLRQALHAKQEPFVLQDVIHEKRHPMRTPSSRALKFETPTMRRSAKKNHITSKHHKHAAGDGYFAACQSQDCIAPKSPTGSAVLARRNRVPVESMVAIPSHQAPALGGGYHATKAHVKVASQGRNPVKSPNKRALLMEAASRILEGSNRRTFKRPPTSVRSLLDDLDESKHVKEPSKPQEKPVTAVALHSESSEREEVASPIVAILGDRAEESKQHQNSYDFKHSGKLNRNSSLIDHFEMSQINEEDLVVVQNKVFPYDNALDETEVVFSLATPVQNPGSENKAVYEQLRDDLFSQIKGTKKETLNHIVTGSKMNSAKVLRQAKRGAVPIVLPEMRIMEDQHPELNCDALLKNSRAIVASAFIDAHADLLPVMLMSTCLANFDYKMPSLVRSAFDYSLARHFIWGYHAAAIFSVDGTKRGECSSGRIPEKSSTAGADETGYTYRSRDNFVVAEKQSSVVQLRLCNYSWWASCQNDSSENCQLSIECWAGYNSPVAAKTPYFGKVWNEEMTEEGASDYMYPVDELLQASPVSVLEPVYEELELADSFDNFEEARQKLLEKVRRYEMLAHMDVDMLKKVSQEHIFYAWDEDELLETSYNYSCSSSASDSFSQASPAHDTLSIDMEAQDSSNHFTKEPYFLSPEGQCLYGEAMETRWISSLECSTEKLELRPISYRVVQSQSSGVRGGDCSKEVGGVPNCNLSRSVGAHMVNSLLHKDLAMSNWSSSTQEGEAKEVELELESCFFEVLMCELLSDLLKPLCNALIDQLGNPVQKAERFQSMLPILT